MELLGQQARELIEMQDEFVVLLDTDGNVIYSNLKWLFYCMEKQIETAFWELGANYFEGLNKIGEKDFLDKIKQSLKYKEHKGEIDVFFKSSNLLGNLFVRYNLFSFNNGTTGIAIYKKTTDIECNSLLNTELILENMSDSYCLLDKDMNIYYLNSKCEILFGYKKENLIGKSIWTVFPYTIESPIYFIFTRVMKERVPLEVKEHMGTLGLGLNIKVYPAKSGGLALYCRSINKERPVKSEIECIDSLTGLKSRQDFQLEVNRFLIRETPFSLLYINLDNFSYINAVHEYRIGDEVIKLIANEIKTLLSKEDIVGRFDGDEFVILSKIGETQIFSLLNKLKNLFLKPFSLKNTQTFKITASIGVSFCPNYSSNADELIFSAKAAMLEAKKTSGTTYSFSSSNMTSNLNRRLLIEKSLSGDLSNLGFHFVLQPQINSLSKDLNGIEVLSRWNHPEIGFISPIEFIQIAEETGTIFQLTIHLMEEVFIFIRESEKQYGWFPKTAINITSTLLASNSFFDDMYSLMDKHQISYDQIELEITESTELTRSEITLQNLLKCRTRGISIALDDFGTGFSMFSYLSDFPIDKVKIDKSFIAKIGSDEKSEDLLKFLIQFIRNTGYKIVAEGIETEYEANYLKKNGCIIHQGYFYDRPLSPIIFEKKYLTNKNDMKNGYRKL